jgi:hypothetical protein
MTLPPAFAGGRGASVALTSKPLWHRPSPSPSREGRGRGYGSMIRPLGMRAIRAAGGSGCGTKVCRGSLVAGSPAGATRPASSERCKGRTRRRGSPSTSPERSGASHPRKLPQKGCYGKSVREGDVLCCGGGSVGKDNGVGRLEAPRSEGRQPANRSRANTQGAEAYGTSVAPRFLA